MNVNVRPMASMAATFTACLLFEATAADSASPAEGQLLGGKETTYPAWFKESFLEVGADVAEAGDEGRRLILFFHQDNCPYCNALVERNLSQKHIEEKMRRHFDVVALNLRGDREVVSIDGTSYSEKDFALALNVRFTPTLLFLDEEGNLVLRLNGYVPPPEFEAALDYVAARMESGDVGFREYAAGVLQPGDAGALHREPFFSDPPYDLSRAPGPGKPLAVFFEQKQCPACDTLHEDVIADETTLRLLEPFESIQLDMWSGQAVITPDGRHTTARLWASALDVQYAPTIVLFSPAGEEIIRMEAVFKRFHAQSVLDYAASGAYLEQPDFQRFLTERTNRIRASGQDVDIWK